MCLIASSIKLTHKKTGLIVITKIACNLLDPPQVLQSDTTKLSETHKEHVCVGGHWLPRSVFFSVFMQQVDP